MAQVPIQMQLREADRQKKEHERNQGTLIRSTLYAKAADHIDELEGALAQASEAFQEMRTRLTKSTPGPPIVSADTELSHHHDG